MNDTHSSCRPDYKCSSNQEVGTTFSHDDGGKFSWDGMWLHMWWGNNKRWHTQTSHPKEMHLSMYGCIPGDHQRVQLENAITTTTPKHLIYTKWHIFTRILSDCGWCCLLGDTVRVWQPGRSGGTCAVRVMVIGWWSGRGSLGCASMVCWCRFLGHRRFLRNRGAGLVAREMWPTWMEWESMKHTQWSE